MLKTIRYIFFIPIALISSVIISVPVQFVGNMFFGSIIGWALSGLFGGMSFIIVGLYVSPKRTEAIKYILAGLLLFFSVLSAIGIWVNSNYSYQIWGPVASAAVVLGSLKMPVKELIKEDDGVVQQTQV